MAAVGRETGRPGVGRGITVSLSAPRPPATRRRPALDPAAPPPYPTASRTGVTRPKDPSRAMTTPSRLTMTGIVKHFGPTAALRGVDLDLRPGEVHALVGENGAGKSTLMKVLSGAVTPDAGRMTLDGQSYAPRNPQDARRQGVAMIYQELTLAPHLSVADNVTLGLE